jgi:hypothetical protein
MKPLEPTPELRAVAARTVWFKAPDLALADPAEFLAYLLTYGTYEDVAVVRRRLSLDDLRDALDQAPPGIFDPRSWSYWNLIVGRYPAPPLPVRTFGGG